MLPEVQEYFDELAKLRAWYEEENKKLQQKFNDKTLTYTAYDIKSDRIYNRCRARLRALKIALQNEKNHPIVRWMAKNASIRDFYWEYAEDVLRQLPATVDELHTYAKSNDWCGVWDKFKEQALQDGVLDGFVRLEYKQNNQEWKEFRRTIRMADGENLTREDVMKWFRRGAKTLSFSIRQSTYQFRLVGGKPLI